MDSIKIVSDRKMVTLDARKILYINMNGKNAEIHVAGGNIYSTRVALRELEQQLDEEFIKVHRGCVVSARAVYDVTDKINLSNGESLLYTIRKKKKIVEEIQKKQRIIIDSFERAGIPSTTEEYQKYYSSFEDLPIAFTDIEMIFDEEYHAVDWIFRYGNQELARLEKLSIEQMIGRSFGSLFANMDAKWLQSYERAALYGEIVEIMDYSPEIDTNLKVICFPTFRGHCGCILFDLDKIKIADSNSEAHKLWMSYLRRNLRK